MGDFIWFIIIGVIFILLCLVFNVFGWNIWKKHKIDLIISYHCDRVSEENKKGYCKLFGIGMIVMGAGFGLSGIITVFIQSGLSFIPMAVGLVCGIGMLIFAGVKYNH